VLKVKGSLSLSAIILLPMEEQTSSHDLNPIFSDFVPRYHDLLGGDITYDWHSKRGIDAAYA
jgi:hypothetical protein